MRTVIEKVILLQDVDVFTEVPTENLAVLAAIADEVSLLEGDTLYRQHDPADALYLVLDGRVALRRGERTISEAGPGEAFGTWALFDEEPRLVSAEVVADATLLRIDRDDFVDLMADHVQIAQGVIKAVARRLRGLAARGTNEDEPE
jgi:CRP-like cAMP-binding protein